MGILYILMKRLLLYICLLLAPAAQAWESQLFPWGGSSYSEATVNYNSTNWRLLDFSYAGFELGASSLGSGIPCNTFTVTGSGDITAELQTLVDNAIAASGGRVIIPAGTYTITDSIVIDGNDISIEGAGSSLTFINVPNTYTPADANTEGLFTFGIPLSGFNQSWFDRGDELADVSSTITEGDTVINVSSVVNMNVGDWIMVRQYFWPAFSAAHSSGNWNSYSGWPSPPNSETRDYTFSYLRKISAVAASTITLDVPIPWTLDPSNNPVKIQSAVDDNCSAGCVPSWIAAHDHLGISGLTINFADNNNDTGYSPARAMGNAVYFEGVHDGWVYDIHMNNVPHYGVYVDASARITIKDCAVKTTQDDGGSGYGYAYHIGTSQNILVKDNYSEKFAMPIFLNVL